jgi:16S rRNA (guanine527-N7)-methyltransferase
VTDGLREALLALTERFVLPPAAAGRLEALLGHLARADSAPTTVSRPAEALEIHLADSLVGLEVPELRSASTLADIGSGAGFPGLPLAIALPSTEVTLIEASHRRCAYLEAARHACGAANARVACARVEEWAGQRGEEASGGPMAQRAGGYSQQDVATARAVAPLAVLLEYAAPLLRVGGSFVGWKGARRAEEETAAEFAAEQLGLNLVDIRPTQPFPAARHRHLYVYLKVRETPELFPRRPGMARKRPLEP